MKKSILWRAGLAAVLSAAGCGGDQGLDGEPGEPGASGAASLVSSTELAPGDADCPGGGTRLDFGLDNGDGGETAGDGVLGAGEVDGSTFLCDGVDEDPLPPLTGPAGPAGQYILDLSGGDGTDGPGGQGGPITVILDPSTDGGNLKLFSTGVADASFTTPDITPDLGDDPAVVTADATVFQRAGGDNTDLVNGSLVQRDANSTLFRFNGTSDEAVTGLSIAAGVTLTFEDPGDVSVPAGIINAGTITSAFSGDGVTRFPVSLSCAAFVGTEGSSIMLAGGDATTGNPGGEGGGLNINANAGVPAGPGSAGIIINHGAIDTSGGQGDSGGQSGYVSLTTNGAIYNTGNIDASGGPGTVTVGGYASGLNMFSSFGGIRNSGNFAFNGGVGAEVGGFSGGVFINATGGSILNGGNIDAGGGDSDPACTSGCSAGGCSGVYLYSYGGDLRSSGDIDCSGGDAVGGAGSSGGPIGLYAYDSGSPIGPLAAGTVEISGNLSTHGGSGEEGGTGSSLDIFLASNTPLKQELVLYGYTDLDISGGNGTTSGGSGGNAYVYSGSVSQPPPAGGSSIVIEPNVHAFGGAASAGGGGSGAYLDIRTESGTGFGSDQQYLIVRGDLDNRGGDGSSVGGSGPGMALWGLSGVTLSGSILAGGGSGANSGGSSSLVDVQSADGDVVLEGALISTAAGSCTANGCNGGEAGDFVASGLGLASTADYSVAGGDAGATDGIGGNAGNVILNAFSRGATSSAANVDILGGTGGGSTGANGEYFVGGVNQSGPFLP